MHHGTCTHTCWLAPCLQNHPHIPTHPYLLHNPDTGRHLHGAIARHHIMHANRVVKRLGGGREGEGAREMR